MLCFPLVIFISPLIFDVVTSRPSPFIKFPAVKDCYEIETLDWILVSCPNGKISLRAKTKELIIDSGKTDLF